MEKMVEIVLCLVLAASLGLPGVTAAARKIHLGRTTHIVGRDGLCLDVIGGYGNDHVPTQLWPCGPQKNQQWTILTDGTIRSMEKCLVPYGNNVGDYAMIDDCYNSSPDAKTWKLWPDGTLSHVHSGLVLTAKTAGPHTILTLEKNEYAPGQGWDATDDVAPVVANIVGLYRMCLQAQKDNTHVWLNNCGKDNKQQYWAFYSDGTIRANYDTSLCLTSVGKNSDAPISLSKCQGLTEQRWEPFDDGTIVNLNTGLVMDVRGSDPSLHQIILYARNGYPNQRWSFL